jgi:monolysocardiolipin acyltransferase
MVLARCAVGLTCKAFLNLGLCSLSVDGLPHLLSELQSPRRQEGQGIITGQRLLQPKERY